MLGVGGLKPQHLIAYVIFKLWRHTSERMVLPSLPTLACWILMETESYKVIPVRTSCRRDSSVLGRNHAYRDVFYKTGAPRCQLPSTSPYPLDKGYSKFK